jgi:hypothetical protein
MTLNQEINHIWAKKWSVSTLIFAVNRYVTFALALTDAPRGISHTVSITIYSLSIRV